MDVADGSIQSLLTLDLWFVSQRLYTSVAAVFISGLHANTWSLSLFNLNFSKVVGRKYEARPARSRCNNRGALIIKYIAKKFISPGIF